MKYFNENSHLMVLTSDKLADLVIFEKSMYHEKLENALHSNFKKIKTILVPQ